MYGKEEAKELKTLFWTSFGKYMKKHPSLSGKKVKWFNYQTGVKDIYFRLYCDKKHARICIELQHRDPGIRELFFAQFKELKAVLESEVGEEWTWDREVRLQEGHTVDRIGFDMVPANLYNKDDWQNIFTFFEPRLLALDRFWSEFSEIFKELAK